MLLRSHNKAGIRPDYLHCVYTVNQRAQFDSTTSGAVMLSRSSSALFLRNNLQNRFIAIQSRTGLIASTGRILAVRVISNHTTAPKSLTSSGIVTPLSVLNRPGTMKNPVRSISGTDTSSSAEESRIIDPKCIFCKILSDKIPSSQVYEDDICRIIMDIHPMQRGHVLIIPRQHYQNIVDMPEDVAMHMTFLASKLTIGLTHQDSQNQFECDGANLMWNNGRAAWQTVMHAHLHVIPRRRGDSLRFIFGLVRHLFSLLGVLPPANRQELDKIAAVFHNVLSKQMKNS